MTQTNFEFCLEYIFKIEGGFVNHISDRGGATNFGITAKTLADYRGVEKCSQDDVLKITKNDAAKIYELKYWNTMRLDRIRNKKIALILFDHGVNSGPISSIKLLQEVLNDSFGESLLVDGVLGNKTDASISKSDGSRLCRKLIQKIQTRYVAICQKNPEQLVFLMGWLNRTFWLTDVVS